MLVIFRLKDPRDRFNALVGSIKGPRNLNLIGYFDACPKFRLPLLHLSVFRGESSASLRRRYLRASPSRERGCLRGARNADRGKAGQLDSVSDLDCALSSPRHKRVHDADPLKRAFTSSRSSSCGISSSPRMLLQTSHAYGRYENEHCSSIL